MLKVLSYKPFGVKAILIEWEARISTVILNDIINFKTKISFSKNDVLDDCIVGYHSLTLVYKERINDFLREVESLKRLSLIEDIKNSTAKYIWEIPVCYDLQFGIDLEEMSRVKNINIDEIIKFHTQNLYTVYFIGFLPGFLYLGGLNKILYMNRKATPRLEVFEGAVAIGGNQTGVYPSKSPGGWNILGKTPVLFFNHNNSTPCFAKSGDKIRFKPVNLEEFKKLEKEIKNGNYIPVKEIIYD
ncbi:inhibitor of KinA [Tenacibaculum sp. MAR_2010_89]|uniref:5-oxoprolinase subunit PxpB n=1 Tax=Tenacibaculum sp. MAR_2010_89 TaxID=1250198 RepID=UPI00089B5E01|nr:5-oxoprolinase subunit PxpB [Tenacibaculum sp. MAR_2010_89]SEE13665.1 inhibitor of KinA [Tenacibaculum sp. MAR_2010_89]